MKAQSMYSLSHNQIVDALKATGHLRTMLIEGDMGSGKSTILRTLAKLLPTHTPVYFDATTKDLGDLFLPDFIKASDDSAGYVTYLTNEELGLHHNKPIILMIDEFGKANPAVKNGLLRVMLERTAGSATLHPESIVFATTNLGAEGVGDLLPPHARNRISVVRMRKPSVDEYIDYGINNGFDPSLLGWVKDNPQVMQSFTDVQNPDDNPYIYHPKAQRAAFFTPRSGEAASDILKQRDHMDEQTLTAMLMGTIGDRGAMDLSAYIKLADQLPKRADIMSTPDTATVPTSASAVVMVVYRALASIDKDFITPWMTYIERLDSEAQALFANGVRKTGYAHQSLVMTNKAFTAWSRNNKHLFSADV